MAAKFNLNQIAQFESKQHFRIGIAHICEGKQWKHHAWEDYKLIKLSATRAKFRLVDDPDEILTVSAKDLNDDFIRIR